jgi:uncharacterized protein YdaU (DUF1376 family)
MNPIDWNEGTDDLTLEQEGAYLRICNAIYISERPIRDNMFVIAGLLRCSDRKARRLVDDLVKAGKLFIEDGCIVNRRAVDEVSARVRLRMERQSNGSRGGSKTAERRANTLKDNEPAPPNAASKNAAEEIRQEERREPLTPSEKQRYANPVVVLQTILDPVSSQRWVTHCEERGKRPSSLQAEQQVAVLQELKALGAKPAEAVRYAIDRGWVSLSVEFFRNAGYPMKAAIPQQEDWHKRMAVWNESQTWAPAWGPKPNEPGCKAPAELLRAA